MKDKPTPWSIAHCPACGRKSIVTNSRPHAAGLGAVRRIRECIKCKRRWSTVEVLREDLQNVTAWERGMIGFYLRQIDKILERTNEEDRKAIAKDSVCEVLQDNLTGSSLSNTVKQQSRTP